MAGFSPVHLRGISARQVSCYALFKGWPLLSLPPCCLSKETPFCLTLSQHLGTLTQVWVNPLSVVRLTPHKPVSRLLLSQHLRSSKERWTLSDPCLSIGALQRWQHPPRLDLDLLRWELDITELDWLLAPYPESGEGVARHHPFGPPPGFRPASSCSGQDRSVSSLILMTTGPI